MSLALEIENALMQRSGPLLTGDLLVSSLGYPSETAFRKAVERNTVPVAVFTIPRRRGQYALSRDVALWLAEQREKNSKRQKNADVEEINPMP
tara:strand:- start:1395 stop:1673 length:279 start_codon:yes stop_codon:yes gene_type:complete